METLNILGRRTKIVGRRPTFSYNVAREGASTVYSVLVPYKFLHTLHVRGTVQTSKCVPNYTRANVPAPYFGILGSRAVLSVCK